MKDFAAKNALEDIPAETGLQLAGTLQVGVSACLLGYLKNKLAAPQLQDLVETIDAYRRGDCPLVVPVRMLQHHFRGNPHPCISRQVYLCSHPQAPGLRNRM